MSVVGFDFGNSSGVVGVAQKGGIDVILNDVSSRQTPSMAAFGEKERYLGDSASTQYLRNIKNTITNVKRLLGRKFDDAEVQQELKSCPFKAVKLPDETVGVEVMYCNEKKVFSITAVAGMVLQKLKQTTEKATGFAMRDVAIGVPGWWTDRQRRALIDAAVIAGLNPLRLVNEITATALAWGIYKTTLSETEPTYVMFYDMGESQTSAAVVEFLKGKLKILSSSYDRNLGGRNFDELLVEHFCKEFKEKYKLDIKSNQKALIRLQIACEKLKKMLNTNPEAPINVDSIMNDIDVKGLMKRADFEAVIQPLLERAAEPARRALAESGIPLEKLVAIEISGGSTRLIPVQNKLTEVFKKDLSKTQNFEETVARGAALQCAMLSPVFRVREFSITDINPYPIKFSWKNISADPMQVDNKDSAEIFGKNSVVPSTKMITLHRNEGVELSCEYNDASLLPTGIETFIGKFVLPSMPVNKKEEPLKIRVKVKLNIHSIVEVESAEVVETIEEAPATPTEATTPAPAEPATTEPTPMQTEEKPAEPKADANANTEKKEEEKKKVKVNRISVNVNSHTPSLVQKELQDLIDEEARMVASDRLAFETAEKKNAVESYIYEMRDKLSSSLSDFATQTEKDSLLKIFDATQDWLYGEGEDATKSVYVKKLDEMKVIGDPVTKRAYEHENRIDSVSQLRNTLEQFKLTATLEDPKYEHIPAEEKQKIVTECNNTAIWLNEKVAQQDKLAKHADPVFTVQELNKKKDEVSKFCNAILSKPKPKPEPKKEEPKKEEPKKEEEKKTDAKPEAKEGQKNDMDLD